MNDAEEYREPILVLGSNKLAYSLVISLRNAGHPVMLSTRKARDAWKYIGFHKGDLRQWEAGQFGNFNVKVIENFSFHPTIRLAIVIAEENLTVKKNIIKILESRLSPDTLIAVNSEAIPLELLRKDAAAARRILVANWVEPVDTTFFLEIIANRDTDEALVKHFEGLGRKYWGKDPYVIGGETGIRMKLMAALIREAFYLVKNGYATIADVDRACRNDAGYYLPFAGNLRYMDLMGTNAYGMVMKDLNPELATDKLPPDFFLSMMQRGETGMTGGKGFYSYRAGESENWEILLKKFSHQVHELIGEYPFNYKKETADI
ncbi:3-hydroxyacyl-CoA dehydrogenase family protein [Dyadobacter bucti]|uniref:3-hydroxyacyl-CoA dehydrogenase family protein n=1 Tax=Dyadobacter bucti TaxID=2572203 RepID=UPI003F70610A